MIEHSDHPGHPVRVALAATVMACAFAAHAAPASLYDGADGVSCGYFNTGAKLLWENKQGDWSDAADRPQGGEPFARARVADIDRIQTIEWDVTELVRKTRSGSEIGMLIMSTQADSHSTHFQSREKAAPEAKPKLTIEYTDGRREILPVSADATLDCTTTTPIGNRDTIAAGDHRRLVLAFPAPKEGAVRSATLTMTTIATQYGNTELAVFRLRAPQPPSGPPRMGLAAAYPQDRDIGKDPDVVFATGFESFLWKRDWSFVSNGSNVDAVAGDEALNFRPLAGKALRVEVPKGQHLGLHMGYKFKDKTGAEPEEIYFRYYLRLADTWNGALEGGKLPGISGTYDRGGWGGRKSDGYNGWSARGEFWRMPGPGNPLRDRVPIGNYGYHAQMQDFWGDPWYWSRQMLGLLERNRWYAIEQYVKLNTPGRSDGILRAWVDGYLAFEKTDIRYRETDALKIEMVWMNVYHGGGNPAPQTAHLFIDNVVIARKYIGPMK
jgi:hypothetical protein